MRTSGSRERRNHDQPQDQAQDDRVPAGRSIDFTMAAAAATNRPDFLTDLIALADSTPAPKRRTAARLSLLAATSAAILALTSRTTDQHSARRRRPSLRRPRNQLCSCHRMRALPPASRHNSQRSWPQPHTAATDRVAIIASPPDLGSVTELWHQPQNYARFLAQELTLIYRELCSSSCQTATG